MGGTAKSVLIVTAHPEPASFNQALSTRAASALRAAGHQVVLSDLCAEGFDPAAGWHDFTAAADPDRFHYQSEQANACRNAGFAPEIAREQARLEAADLLILQFPLWWGGPPAILKGWIDRVMAYGFAYVDGARFGTGLFRGRRAVLSVTTGGTPARFAPDGVYGPIDAILRPISRLALDYMGFEVAPPFVSHGVPRISAEDRAALLEAWAAKVTALAALDPPPGERPADPLSLVPEGAWSRA
ncbi:NAD(P)H-dependent oxidoreductase [Pseudogemmobacter bohemicus]|uniref:NAD(P)H-dependent oxidoreductase n=1 Tax=Pseudogemmobacter bohemicus TaxID=2250708 RepID=UPI000DD4B064|nr:NAD(P)H-dependent oxidoreductase [Pseudogemmobacter bohemicus]